MIDARAPILALALAGCATSGGEGHDGSARADLREPGGRMVGHATLRKMGDGVHIRVDAAGLAAGRYGLHIHMAGRCDSPSFDSAGGHWNPTARRHGARNPQGHHLGDLPNLDVGAEGAGRLDFHVSGASLSDGTNAILDADGASIMIHAEPDDERTDPSGNSGARIACGVLR